MEPSKRYMVVVHLPVKATRVSEVVGNLGSALRTADAHPIRPSVIVSGPTNMLRHSKEAFSVPKQPWLNTKQFLAHCYAVSALFGFKVEVIQNVAAWDVREAREGN